MKTPPKKKSTKRKPAKKPVKKKPAKRKTVKKPVKRKPTKKKVKKAVVKRKPVKKPVKKKPTKKKTVKKVVKKKKPKGLSRSKVPCAKCKELKSVAKLQLERLIGKFGSLEDVHEKYHCIKCRKEYNVRKDGTPKPIVQKRKKKKKIIYKPKLEGNYFKRPEGVSKEKFLKAIRGAIAHGKKKGWVV